MAMRKKINFLHSLAAFTLVELMITVMLVTVIGMSLFYAMSTARSSWYLADAQISLQQELRKAALQIAGDLKGSSACQTSFPCSNCNKTSLACSSYSNDSISFNASEGMGSNGSMVWVPVGYRLNAGLIEYLYNVTTTNVTSRAINVTALNFSRTATAPEVFNVFLAGQRNATNSRVITANVTTSAALRN